MTFNASEFNREWFNSTTVDHEDIVDATVYARGETPTASLAIVCPTATNTFSALMYYQMVDWVVEPIVCTMFARGTYGGLNWTIPVSANMYVLPIAPTAQPFIVNPTADDLCIGCSSSHAITDKMSKAVIDYSTEVDIDYFKYVRIAIPDYTGTSQYIFIGFFPSSNTMYGADGVGIQYTAYDFGWYLMMQYLSTDNMVLQSPLTYSQALSYTVYYRNEQAPAIVGQPVWKVGQIVSGTRFTGNIVEVHRTGYQYQEGSWIVFNNVVGTTVNGAYVIDGEHLFVNGNYCADAYGIEMSTGGIFDTPTPDIFVKRLLGGDNTGSHWETTTGIFPYRITATSWSTSSDPPAVNILFEEKTTKMQAIERLCTYLGYIFMVKNLGNTSTSIPVAYFIPETAIDTPGAGLDLPAMVTFTKPSPYVVSPIKKELRGDEKYNKVTIRGMDLDRVWYESTKSSDGVLSGEDLPIEFIELNQDIATQAEADERCDDVFNYYNNQIQTYTVTFNMRSDLRLLQLVNFVGYSEFPSYGTPYYRIVGIQYNYSKGGTINQQVCTIIPNYQFSFYLNLNRVFTDAVSEARAIAIDEIRKAGMGEVGKVLAVNSDGTFTVEMEGGTTKIISNPNA